MQKINLGKATIQLRVPLVAGSFETLTYTYTAGHPIDDSGYLKVAFRSVGDFGILQFTNPTDPNYCTIKTNGDCRLIPRWDPRGNTRPWFQALYIKITGGFLNTGEKITVIFGDQSKGSPGWQIQTFCERTFEFKTYVDPFATYEFKELPHSPEVRIIPGKPARVVCIAPSQVKVGNTFIYYLKLEDRWGNPTKKPRRCEHRGFSKPGVQFIRVKDHKTRFSACSNPIDVTNKSTPLHPYWADFHGQSEETIGSNSIDDYFTFARDYGLLDICAHQGNDFQITDEFWEKINQTTHEYYEPGSFVTFPGFEWSGNTPLGGDRNVYFKKEGGVITRSSCELLPGKKSAYKDSHTANELFRILRTQREHSPFVLAHVGGRYADLSIHDSAIEVGGEVHSALGTFEWLVGEAFQRGFRIGICANSDGHKTRPGASYPGARTFGSYGGLTCVLAERLDRDHIHEAIMARHFYATTGNRSLLDVTLLTNDGRQAIMGDVISAAESTVLLRVRIVGTGPIERVDVRNGIDTIRTLHPFDKIDLGKRIKVVWSGAEVKGRDRMTRWDGSLIIKNNRIVSFTPINFWNPMLPIEHISCNRLKWKSVTTGGVAGIILEFEKKNTGTIEIDTVQRKAKVKLKSVGLMPKTWKCGGLYKQMQVYRLPDSNDFTCFGFQLPIKELQKGDNPLYVCVHQEDGHMAWSSPIYLVK
jgi:hypothetical protein